MKKAICICMTLVLLMTAVSAFASGIGRVLPDPVLDLTELIGSGLNEYEALLAQNGKSDPSGVRVLDQDGVISGFYIDDPGFSLCGYSVEGRASYDLTERMEADGWTTKQDQYEGGLRFHTFERETHDALFIFRLHSSDYVITSVSLEAKRVQPEAVVADPAQAKELYKLGYAYEMGRDVEKDPVKAMEYYLRAAEMGHAPAFTRIGLLYRSGEGVERNAEEAMKWLMEAIELGDANAADFYAEMHMNGQGIEKDPETALYWYVYAAEHGSHRGQYNAGRIYYEGKIVPQDLERARELLMMGGDRMLPGAVKLLEELDAMEQK